MSQETKQAKPTGLYFSEEAVRQLTEAVLDLPTRAGIPLLNIIKSGAPVAITPPAVAANETSDGAGSDNTDGKDPVVANG